MDRGEAQRAVSTCVLELVLLLWLFLGYCVFSYSEYIFSIIVLHFVSGIVAHLLMYFPKRVQCNGT